MPSPLSDIHYIFLTATHYAKLQQKVSLKPNPQKSNAAVTRSPPTYFPVFPYSHLEICSHKECW